MRYIFFILFILLSCEKKQIEKKEIYYPVKTAKAIEKEAINYIDNIGHVTSINSVDIKPKIEGEIFKIHFKEGAYVKKGAILFTIDPRPYENALEKARAALKENIANLYIAKDKVKRYSLLTKDQYISELEFETLKTNVL
ncbi:unnamed protein product, partial [marine sediment metagenome]